jgi:hypothetical protein
MRTLTLGLLLLVGCSDGAVVAELPEDETGFVEEDTATDSAVPEDSTTVDSSTTETTPMETSVTDSAKPDTAPPPDMGPVDVGTTFACGSMMCGTSLQFCRRATGPGTCPTPDSGLCPAGCPGCAPLSMTCETLPMKCWAKPSCNCILGEICGSPANGDCTEKDGGFTAGCRGA